MEILIVEDDPGSRAMLKHYLEKTGHRVMEADNGAIAWDILQKNRFDVVITDWTMPRLDGPSLCRNIRSLNIKGYIYVILATAKDQKMDRVAGLNAGADDYITKPIYNEELGARLRTAERIINLETRYQTSMSQLLQSEKMASIGQIAAGVAHEINNPIGFIKSNIRSLSEYMGDFIGLIRIYRELVAGLKGGHINIMERIDGITQYENKIDTDYLLTDASELVRECEEGIQRIEKIVIDLKDFAHPGAETKQLADLNTCIESTLNVVRNEIKYKATVHKDYGELPLVDVYAGRLNQVFMNILVNAAQAIVGKGDIFIRTRADTEHIIIEIRDTGAGIPEKNLKTIFDPFFTTKEVGKGTGLGLYVAYNIIKTHNGRIDVSSKVGEGTTFTIRLPV